MACDHFIFLLANIVALHLIIMQAKSAFKFTNLKCLDHDVNFSRFEICRLKVIGRGVITLNIKVALYKTPVTNSTLNIALYKKANGFKPFLYNYTVDLCAFFANRKRYSVVKVLMELFVNNSNINHTCPYNDALMIKDLVFDEDRFQLLPIPEGEYMIKGKVFAYNELKGTTEAMFYRQDSLMP
uniref:MD-2-related lipid-recognition domain-containing protein n=1 Tax=Stomoxys calcitrans TaxID=35570 RepID=A0A1I8Q8T4_STOCA